MTFMMFFVRLKIVDEPMSIAVKTGAMKRGNWAMEMTVLPDDRCCDRSNNLCNGFLEILPGPAVVKDDFALKN
jgi:hypothetical protein